MRRRFRVAPEGGARFLGRRPKRRRLKARTRPEPQPPKHKRANSSSTRSSAPTSPTMRPASASRVRISPSSDEEFDRIEGGKGADTYDGKSGGDDLFDASRKSNDLYLIPATEFNSGANGGININDRGGRSDVLDFSAYSSTDFALSRFNSGGDKSENLPEMQGPGNRTIGISFFFTKNTIDKFKFSDGTLTAKQIKQKIQ